jgi:hypothetical protein
MSRKLITTEEFIKKAKIIHNDKYDYIDTIYTKAKNKIDILCKKHGLFKQMAYRHINGNGCPRCAFDKNGSLLLLSEEEWNLKRIKVHGDKYDCLNKYINSKIKLLFKCNINSSHKNFYCNPNNHLNGGGCPECYKPMRGMSQKKNVEWLQSLAKKNNGICHSLIYINNTTKYLWECEKKHKWLTNPKNITRGSWCPICYESTGEKSIKSYLEKEIINYEREYRFDQCKNKKKTSF